MAKFFEKQASCADYKSAQVKGRNEFAGQQLASLAHTQERRNIWNGCKASAWIGINYNRSWSALRAFERNERMQDFLFPGAAMTECCLSDGKIKALGKSWKRSWTAPPLTKFSVFILYGQTYEQFLRKLILFCVFQKMFGAPGRLKSREEYFTQS